MRHPTESVIRAALVLLLLAFPSSRPPAQEVHDGLTPKLKELSAQIASHIPGSKPMKIAVAAFADPDGKVSPLGKYIAEQLTTHLFETGKFRLIQRPIVEKAITDQKLEGSNLAQPDQVKRICKAVGAKALVTGTFTDLGATLGLSARLLSADKAVILSAASTEVAKDETVRRMLPQPEPAKPAQVTLPPQPAPVAPPPKPAERAEETTKAKPTATGQGYPAYLGEFAGLGFSLEDVLEESTTLKLKLRYYNKGDKSKRLFFRNAWLIDETGNKSENIGEVGFEGEVSPGASKLGFLSFRKPPRLEVPFDITIKFEVGGPEEVVGESEQIDIPAIRVK